MQSDCLELVQVREGFLSIRAAKDIACGSFLTDIWGTVISTPNLYSVQLTKEKHIMPEGPVKFTNHSCQPNAKIVFEKRDGLITKIHPGHEVFGYMVACQDIQKGDDIRFDYTTTEYEMAESFQCDCGMACCLGEIKGFKFLTPEQRRERKNSASPAMQALCDNL